VQKARRGGYDGKGVVVFTDIIREDRILPVPSVLEAHVDFSHELAVMVARSPRGETACYPVVEMVFDAEANLLDTLLAPARVPEPIARAAQALALDAVRALEGVGLFGVELFLTREGELLLNEVAPRSHNSGHWTNEACLTSQFEQHLRAILDLPLGATTQLRPAAMLNLVAGAEAQGAATLTGLEAALATPGCTVHLYGKAEARPFRKMGHATVLAESGDAALATAQGLRDVLRFGEPS
jgi:Phosphoribosylaminoimidazole carboxylase (NCAIR synthetase)